LISFSATKDKTRILILCIFLIYSPFIWGQKYFSNKHEKAVAKSGKDLKLNGEYFAGYWHDTKYIFTNPVRWKKNDWIKAGVVGGTGIVLFIFDDEIRNWVQDIKGSTGDDIGGIFEPLGDNGVLMPWAPLIPLYLYGHFAKRPRAADAAMLALEGYVISGVLTQALKYSINRKRPDGGSKSFPSGHASSTFAVATAIAMVYHKSKIIPPLMYTLATLASLSRIVQDKHWASDVWIGAAMGFFFSRTIVKLHYKSRNRLTMVPVITPDQTSFTVFYRF